MLEERFTLDDPLPRGPPVSYLTPFHATLMQVEGTLAFGRHRQQIGLLRRTVLVMPRVRS